MKLLDLKPKWMRVNGEPVSMIFLCPVCIADPGRCDPKRNGRDGPPTWLTCTFKVIKGSDQRELIELVIAAEPDDFVTTNTNENDVVGCRELAWKRGSKMFETLTVTPSLDASPAGHWHGNITGGQIVGGI